MHKKNTKIQKAVMTKTPNFWLNESEKEIFTIPDPKTDNLCQYLASSSFLGFKIVLSEVQVLKSLLGSKNEGLSETLNK